MKYPPLGTAVAAFLYGAICLTANAVADGAGGDLSLVERETLKALRSGDMTKLVIHDHPRSRIEDRFRDLYGNPVSLDDYAGKVVLLNIWATWCPPCRAEMPALDRLAGEMEGSDFAVIALSADRAGAEHVARFFKETQVEHLKVMHDRSGNVARRAGVLGLPVTLILDRQGREIGRMLGDADWDSSEARALIREVIEITRDAAAPMPT